MTQYRLAAIGRVEPEMLGWVSDVHRGYGNFKGHKEEGLGRMDDLVAGVLLSGDVGTETLGSNSCCCIGRGEGWPLKSAMLTFRS